MKVWIIAILTSVIILGVFVGMGYMVAEVTSDESFRNQHALVWGISQIALFTLLILKPNTHFLIRILLIIFGMGLHVWLITVDPTLTRLAQYKFFSERWLEKAQMGFILTPYLFVSLVFSIFVPVYVKRYKSSRIVESGLDALGYLENARDTGTRLKEGSHRLYEMKLKLRIEGHPKSPYRVSGKFWVSEFYIHRMSSAEPISVRVDRNNHKNIALNFDGSPRSGDTGSD